MEIGKAMYLIFLYLIIILEAIVDGSVGDPDFISGVQNVTVSKGRHVTLSCKVKNLGTHKVAWIHYDKSAILTVQNNVITRNPRIGVTHDGNNVWSLHIRDVESEDEGQYMCQINTAKAKTRLGHLHVVVPPRILDGSSSSDMVQTEGSNVSLRCEARGNPMPSVVWKREDGKSINLSKNESVMEVSGSDLRLWKVSRMDMGAYMCIAKNGVPPAVSKRIQLGIDFPPMIWVPEQLISVYSGESVRLTCVVEAHPASLNYWEKDGNMLHHSRKFMISKAESNPAYKVEMILDIDRLKTEDFGMYKCVAKNPRGQTDGTITLYEKKRPSTLPPPTTPTTTTELVTYKVYYDSQVNTKDSYEFKEEDVHKYNKVNSRFNPTTQRNLFFSDASSITLTGLVLLVSLCSNIYLY